MEDAASNPALPYDVCFLLPTLTLSRSITLKLFRLRYNAADNPVIPAPIIKMSLVIFKFNYFAPIKLVLSALGLFSLNGFPLIKK